MNIKDIICFIAAFLFFAIITVGALFFIVGSVLCLIHVFQDSTPDGREILSLIIVSLIGGAIGLICYMNDVIE